METKNDLNKDGLPPLPEWVTILMDLIEKEKKRRAHEPESKKKKYKFQF